jgi:hypothetical protein
VFTVAELNGSRAARPVHSSAVCTRLLGRFMVEPAVLRPLIGESDGALSDRQVVERLASALWGTFSHHRAVLDAHGNRFDMGSWRAAAELIADAVNRRFPMLAPPIRYMDCYMGVLLGDERCTGAEPLYRWIFSGLRDAGCDWLYSHAGEAGDERRVQRRELSAALSRAYQEHAVYAPLPTLVAAYRQVYSRLPEGWPA